MRKTVLLFISFAFALSLCFSDSSRAGMAGADLETPKPEFSNDGGKFTAKLIPRAKSTSVLIDFEVAGGDLKDVKGLDFKAAERPGHTWRDFRSNLFMMDIGGVEKGGEVFVSVRSSFFTGATTFWIFNERLSESWMNSEAENVKKAEKERELVMKVTDGGPLDSDGAADGKIFLVGGPRDSFWGYVVGTLFIRFFGVFIVLGFLMIGMMLAGLAFRTGEKKIAGGKRTSEADSKPIVCQPERREIKSGVSPETAAVIALALKMHFSASRPSGAAPIGAAPSPSADTSPWSLEGRTRMMTDRMTTFNRNIRK